MLTFPRQDRQMKIASLLKLDKSFPFVTEVKLNSLPDAVYRDLVATLFTMRTPIVGLGILYAFVGGLIVAEWHDPVVAALTIASVVLTTARVSLICGFIRAGGTSQNISDLKSWEQRYGHTSYMFALLLSGLNARGLTIHQPLVHMTTISLVFTFGAGIVSRTAGRPVICIISLLLAVAPTSFALLLSSVSGRESALHAELLAFQALLLAVVGALSLGSVRYLYTSAVEHLTTKHDLAHLARLDPLTGLPNRLLLRESFASSIQSCVAAGEDLAVHYLDLDGFKAINDGYGHPVGDEVLRQVSRRLEATARSGDTISRLGGDEFLVIQTGVKQRDAAEMLARRIIKQISAPYFVDGNELRISVSIGIALAPEIGTDLEHLIACADSALYQSKVKGKAQLHFCGHSDIPHAPRAVA
jgi:diguanylate cyclase (GGDEF)-like protein